MRSRLTKGKRYPLYIAASMAMSRLQPHIPHQVEFPRGLLTSQTIHTAFSKAIHKRIANPKCQLQIGHLHFLRFEKPMQEGLRAA